MLGKNICIFTVGLLTCMMLITFCNNFTSNSEMPIKIASTGSDPVSPSVLVPHAVIRINSDSDTNWTAFPSHTISALNINGTGKGFCIFIGNCTTPFTIQNCFLHNANGSSGTYANNNAIYLYKCQNGTITTNNCSYNDYCGVYMNQCSHLTLTLNKLTQNNGAQGLLIENSNSNDLNNNTLFKSASIYLQVSSNNNLTMNKIYECSSDGVVLDSSMGNIIIRNNITLSGRWGVELDIGCKYNRVAYNIISSSTDYGIIIRTGTSIYNTLHHNILVFNKGSGTTRDSAHVQANDSSGLNFWNDSSGLGNYWADWTSPDVAPPAGVVDSPYLLDGGTSAKDSDPLTTPSGPVPELSVLPLTIITLSALFITIYTAKRKMDIA